MQQDDGSTKKNLSPTIALAVLGIVYGDIGTSPIYAVRECFRGLSPLPVTEPNILGILSLIFWALILVISTKYMIFVLRADNHGEGGIFALLALLRPDKEQDRWSRRLLILLGLFGAALLFGGSMITPAISVLSAVEGLQVGAPGLQPWVLPITIGILVGLFAYQHRGTQHVGLTFGPIMVLWFVTLALLGVVAIMNHPGVLRAASPSYAVQFLLLNGWSGYLVLGGVFLVVTGGEALYADLGHFGARPIRIMWFSLVLPSLLINYFGQGAELLSHPHNLQQPFFNMAPHWSLYPLVIVTTAATVIASQAVISGTFSLTRQAMQLGMIPRMQVRQTAADAHGQIYMPGVNWTLMLAACGLVLSFGSSSALAAAYGLSVNATMLVTSILAFNVAIERGGWSLPRALLLLVGFTTMDLAFLVVNGMKIPDGGWFPLAMGALMFALMATWRRGTELLLRAYEADAVSITTLVGRLENDPPMRLPGSAVFFTARAEDVPQSLLHLLKRTRALQENAVIVTVSVARVPRIKPDDRIQVENFGEGLHAVRLRYGFMQGFNIPSDLTLCVDAGDLPIDMEQVTYYVGHTSILAGRKKGGMMAWRDRLFAFMVRNTMQATSQYQIPAGRVIEIGLQLGI
ncbi:KUP/HAK/KT family potassium transporter [Oleiagrimonas sp.]|uniref:potassium transporter Kup n=1 Tax=Oleiagrimonas sp. TaxID=2010330 RepID=UPI00261AFB28|nr:KUP/HAK/KT family potassium transporter [Oleiagrimonas sp.]MDA3913996.1 KUP/HAK/KT family potassium transporter [Oleiagrimonas sp.]